MLQPFNKHRIFVLDSQIYSETIFANIVSQLVILKCFDVEIVWNNQKLFFETFTVIYQILLYVLTIFGDV